MHILAHDEIETTSSDSMILTNIAFLIVLAGFVIAFKMWGAPLLAMLSLILGIVWDLGIAALVVGRLNIITAMMALILIGLGVDYFIHILNGYTEGRAKGLSGEEAAVYSMEKVGTGVFIGALTTATAPGGSLIWPKLIVMSEIIIRETLLIGRNWPGRLAALC